MTHTVLLFASWSDALGPQVSVELPEGARVADLLDALLARTASAPDSSVGATGPSGAARPLPKPLVAVNQRYAKPDVVLKAGDELAIIPPVAGG
ncbi:MAG: MoaD/ThiS family protein [Gemmatimonadaceae bacterium]|nr:MoaD/ThiS family protein [Gemmatimonadaceae bacterium]